MMRKNIIIEDLEDIYSRNIDWEMFRGSTVLITGANGMLASYFTFMLMWLNDCKGFGIRILAQVRSEERFFKRFGKAGRSENVRVITSPVTEKLQIDEDISFIIHAASLASPQYYDVCPVDVLSPNVLGTYHLLELAAEKKVKCFFMFSTGDVYGKISGRKLICESDLGLLDPLDIHSCYSESKRMAETICISFMKQYSVPVKIARIWHTYAPTMDICNDPRVYASFMRNVFLGEDIVIKSDGLGMRSFCYIADAIAGFFTIITKGTAGEAYNVCNTEQFVTIRELARILASLRTDIALNVSYKKRSTDEHYVENTAIGDAAPDNAKLKSLGWDTKYSIREGFSRVLDYITAMNK